MTVSFGTVWPGASAPPPRQRASAARVGQRSQTGRYRASGRMAASITALARHLRLQALRVRLLLPPLVGDLLGVLVRPGVLAELVRVVAEAVRSAGAGAAGPLPLGLGRQAVQLARLGRQPPAVLHRRVVGDAQHRVA